MTYGAKIAELVPKGGCTCWDCLREKGITPHRSMRDRHKDITQRQFDENVDGHPVPASKSKGEPASAKNLEARSHIRAAIRNREVI